jgi:hypothetical protein
MMALPNPAWATDDPPSPAASEDAKDGVPVLFEEGLTADGKLAYIAIAPIPEAQEQIVLAQLTGAGEGRLMVGVGGPMDPVLHSNIDLGSLQVFDHSSQESAPLLNAPNVPKAWRQKLAAKMRRINEYCRTRRGLYGLLAAIGVSGGTAGYNIYETAHVAPALISMVALFSWVVFQGLFTQAWERYLRGGGELLQKTLATVCGWFGRELTPAEVRAAEVTGEFHSTWAANTAVDAFVFWQAGTLDGVLQAFWYGFLSSYDIGDGAMAERKRMGKITEFFFDNFILTRILAGFGFEIMAWTHMPHAQLVLAALTVGALTYRVVHHEVHRKVLPIVAKWPVTTAYRCTVLFQKRPPKGEI